MGRGRPRDPVHPRPRHRVLLPPCRRAEPLGTRPDPHVSEPTERARLAAIAELGIGLSTPQERFDRITRIARRLLRVPLAEINILEESTQFTKSPQRSARASRMLRADSMCDVTVQQGDILVVEDATADPRFADRGVVTGSPHVRFYAGRPLVVGDGLRVGTICIIDSEVRGFSEEEREILEDLGRWAERELREIAFSGRASETQERLRPQRLDLGEWSLDSLTTPLHDVAGDYTAWRRSGDDLSLELVDVMGKGVSAAIVASAIRSAFQARPELPPAAAVEAVNRQLLPDLTATGMFATALIARVDLASGAVAFVDSGHGLTVLLRADGTTERLASTGVPLGIAADVSWEEEQRVLAPGDALFSCSDGLLDVFGGRLDALDRLAELVRSNDDPALFERLHALADDAHDDVTALVLRRSAAPAPS
ncbi:protein phosphatase [Rathayibacter sp. AY1C7]|nr:protein phosphatase [Rathayibacter sp. AY1C7]